MPLNFDDHRPRGKRGITYVIAGTPYDGWAKIGRTGGGLPHARVQSLQTGNPRKLGLRAVWPVDNEALLHSHYLVLRGQGEWFALPNEMVDFMSAVSNFDDRLLRLYREWPVRRIWDAAGGKQSPAGVASAFAEGPSVEDLLRAA